MSRRYTLASLFVVSIAMALAAFLFSLMYNAYVLKKAEENITNLLLSHKGIHHYVQNTLIPAYTHYQEESKIPPTFYAPELLSSSFIVRNQHLFYNQERKASGYPELYYKLAANNPRNPVNKADALEQNLIRLFNEQPNINSYKEIINFDGRKMLYVAIPFLKNEAHCMRCHSSRELAPIELQQRYPGQAGFNERLGEIRAITSIRAPLEHEYQHIYTFGLAIFVGAFAFIGLFFFNTRLRTLVMKKTVSLEQEIEERKKTEEALRIKESAMATSINAIAMADLEGKLSYVNQAFLSFWGYDGDGDLLGRHFSDLWPDKTEARKLIDTLRQTGSWLGEMQARKKDSTPFEVQVSASMIRNENGAPLCFMASFLDVTEKHHLEDQMRQSQRLEAMGTLAGGIAHDFNNILSPILGYADMVAEELPVDSEAWQYQQAVLKAGFRAKDLVRQILAFARQSEKERLPIQINSIIDETLKLLRASLPSTIEIRQQVDAANAILMADPTEIHQMIMNLCTNAYHAMQEKGGILGLSLRSVEIGNEDDKVTGLNLTPGPYLQLDISDTGSGMDKKTMERIFEPYFTTKEKGKGTGLGLSMVHGIVKRNGGHISVYSEPGRGTNFKVYLPRAVTEVGPAGMERVDRLPTGTERVLIVDDEETVMQMECRMMQSLGYQTTGLVSSTEAWKLLRDQPDAFDLLITDMTLPKMTGIELARRCLSIRPMMPIVLCTGFSELVTEDKAKAIGIREFIMKPVVKRELAEAARRALDSKESNN
jgi:PAS domain S-box-containing protein